MTDSHGNNCKENFWINTWCILFLTFMLIAPAGIVIWIMGLHLVATVFTTCFTLMIAGALYGNRLMGRLMYGIHWGWVGIILAVVLTVFGLLTLTLRIPGAAFDYYPVFSTWLILLTVSVSMFLCYEQE